MIIQSETTNTLLASIAPAEFELLATSAKVIDLHQGTELAAPWKPLDWCWFPVSGIVCSFTMDADGAQAATCLIGNEGLVDAATVLGDEICSTRMYVQVSGQAVCISRNALTAALKSCPTLSRVLLSYVRYKAIQSDAMLIAASSRTLPARLAALLLMMSDRNSSGRIVATHADLAAMLNYRRSGVTTALRGLASSNAIRGLRVGVEVLDRLALLSQAGCTYGDAERAYRRLIAPLFPQPPASI